MARDFLVHEKLSTCLNYIECSTENCRKQREIKTLSTSSFWLVSMCGNTTTKKKAQKIMSVQTPTTDELNPPVIPIYGFGGKSTDMERMQRGLGVP